MSEEASLDLSPDKRMEADLPETQRLIGSPRPVFLVGITGYMKIRDEIQPIVREKIRSVLQWLRDTPWPDAEEECCGSPLGLSKTPIQLLSSLAPGADQIAAEEALNLNIEVRCPVAFPLDLYRDCSTFRLGEGGRWKED